MPTRADNLSLMSVMAWEARRVSSPKARALLPKLQ